MLKSGSFKELIRIVLKTILSNLPAKKSRPYLAPKGGLEYGHF